MQDFADRGTTTHTTQGRSSPAALRIPLARNDAQWCRRVHRPLGRHSEISLGSRLVRTFRIHGCQAVLYDGAWVPILATWNRRARKQVGHGAATQRMVG